MSAISLLDSEFTALQTAGNITATAGCALDQVADLLSNLLELEAQLQDDDLLDDESAALQQEIDELLSQLDATAGGASFGGAALLDGSFGLTFGGHTLNLPAISTQTLGTMDLAGQAVNLGDLARDGALADSPYRSAVVEAALTQVEQTRSKVDEFETNQLGPRLSAYQAAVASLTRLSAQLEQDAADELTATLAALAQLAANQPAGGGQESLLSLLK